MTICTHSSDGTVTTIVMDDGRANALNPTMLAAVGQALDAAEASGDVVVLAGRPGRFSGGFDLRVLTAGGPDGDDMVRGGFALLERLLRFPRPVVVACTGHAVAMGSFLLCSVDLRIGAAGDFRVQANEVAIGITMPAQVLALLRHRLHPAAYERAAGLAMPFAPDAAVAAGFLDETVPLDEVLPCAQEAAAGLAALDPAAHQATKLRIRATLLDEYRAGLAAELGPAPARA